MRTTIKTKRFRRYLVLGGLFLINALLVKLNAQVTDPHVDCTNGCTSNDVQIKTAYLVEPTAPYNALSSSFQCQGSANVKLALDLTTKTPRVGVYVYAKIKDKNTSTVYATVSECFSTALSSGGVTKVVFSQSISWPCGAQIVLTDVFIGWGTGNTDFCAGSSDPRCPATPSKCFELPPGQYITIVIPTASSASATQCETTTGGGTSVFDLTSLNTTVSNNQSNVTVTWFTDQNLTQSISTPSAYTSATATVWAKVANNSDPTAYSKASVSLTVVSRPSIYTLSGNSICASAPNTGVITLSNSQSGVSYQLKKQSDNSDVQSAKSGTGSSLQWTSLPAAVSYYVVATGASPTSCTSQTSTASVSEVANPTAYTLSGNSICSSAPNTGVITLSNSQSGVSYQLKKQSDNSTVQSAKSGTGSSLQWTGLPAGVSYYVTATGATPTSCTSQSNNASVTEVSNPSAPSVTYNPPACDQTTFSVTITGVVSGATYTIKDKNGANIANVQPGNSVTAPNTSNIVFSNIPAGSGYQVTVQVGICSSTASSCGTSTPSTVQRVEQTKVIAPANNLTVKAYPNPFNDRVKFVVNSSEQGNGSLEIYDLLGQKVKTIYQGHVNAGNQVFEMSMPVKQQSTLIYILKVGEKQVTGKLLQIE